MARPLMPRGAPQAHLTDDALTVRVNPKRFRTIIWTSLILGTFFAGGGFVILVWGQEGRGFGVAVFLLGALFLYLGAINCGISRARPVALRLDANGASGYYVPSVTWDEVAMNGVDGADSGASPVFRLHHVQKLRARQKTAWARFGTVATGPQGWHLRVPQLVMDVPVSDLYAHAQKLHAAAK
ncbi:MAG: hypothetical protein ABJJ09_11775 [Ascidiaceihabitans sp.]|uniref:hypothetical protein n=2 Tax=Ascidiaceihabitans sp. TaxID=1872644 RepID=UPI003299E9EF